MGPKSVKRDRKEEDTEIQRSDENRGKYGGDASTSQRAPRTARNHRSQEGWMDQFLPRHLQKEPILATAGFGTSDEFWSFQATQFVIATAVLRNGRTSLQSLPFYSSLDSAYTTGLSAAP